MNRPSILRPEHGSAVLVVGLWLFLLLFLSMATDFGSIFYTQRRLRNACDAGALAGAQDLATSPTANPTATVTSVVSANMQRNAVLYTPAVSVNYPTATLPNGTALPSPVVQVTLRGYAWVTLLRFAYPLPPQGMPVNVQCAAAVVPATQTGLEPIGMSYATYSDFVCKTLLAGQPGCDPTAFTGCPLIGAPQPADMTSTEYAACTTSGPLKNGDFPMTFSVSSQTWGSGNSGTLQMLNLDCSSNTTGASNYACVFALGSGTTSSTGTPPPPYCTTPVASGGLDFPNPNTSNSPSQAWFPCSVVYTKTGAQLGSSGGGTYGTGVRGGVSYICNTYSDPMKATGTGPTWVLTMPVMNNIAFAQISGSNQPIDIVAFANFELDCPTMKNGASLSGSTPTIYGRFVKFLDIFATTGSPAGAPTGITTVILVQ